MKIRLLLVYLALALSMASCAAMDRGYTTHKLVYVPAGEGREGEWLSGMEHCSNLYSGAGFSILEVYCLSEHDGLHISGPEYQGGFDWYDKHFGAWVSTEGCNYMDDCYYEVKVDGRGTVTELKYVFYINQSEGFYRVKVGSGKLKVLEKVITDYP